MGRHEEHHPFFSKVYPVLFLFSFYGCTKIRKDVLLRLCTGGKLDIYEHLICRIDWIRMSLTGATQAWERYFGDGCTRCGFPNEWITFLAHVHFGGRLTSGRGFICGDRYSCDQERREERRRGD